MQENIVFQRFFLLLFLSCYVFRLFSFSSIAGLTQVCSGKFLSFIALIPLIYGLVVRNKRDNEIREREKNPSKIHLWYFLTDSVCYNVKAGSLDCAVEGKWALRYLRI